MKRTSLRLALAILLVFGVLIPSVRAAETGKTAKTYITTLESGPVTKHQPQTYTLDCGTDVVMNVTTGEKLGNGFSSLPFLFPGDTLRFIPVQKPSGELYQGCKGFLFTEDHPLGHQSAQTFKCKDDGKVHVEVIETAAWGDIDEKTHENRYITAVKVVGDEPVKFTSGGSGDYTWTMEGKVPVHKYSARNLEFVYIPAWCRLNTEIWYQFNGSHIMTEEEKATAAFYTDEPSTTVVWAVDAIANSQAQAKGEEKPVLLTIRRPYIEGYYFGGKDGNPQLSTNQVSSVYKYSDGPGWHGGFHEGWLDNQLEYYPRLDNWNGKTASYCAIGSYEDELLVRLKYQGCRTLTLDACGGTIEGYPTRIYEADGRQYFNKELQDGTVDAQLQSGEKYVPVRSGYVFDGWYEDEKYTLPVTSIKDTVNKYSTSAYDSRDKFLCQLYARWIPESHFDLANAEVKGVSGKAYTGKAQKPVPVVTADGETLVSGTDYTVSYKNNTKAGTATVIVRGEGKFHGTKTATFKIAKAANPMKLKVKNASVKYSAVKKKAQTVAAKKIFTVKKSQGKVTYTKASGSGKIKIDKKTGKLTVKKGTKKGTYKITVKVKAAGNSNYKAVTKKVTISVKVK